MKFTAQRIWRYRDIDVFYDRDLDGGGSTSAPWFIDFIKAYFGSQRRFTTVFEWCAGPSFIGFALLAEGLCESLCLADINPAAIECVHKTVETNRLHERVRTYVSDNLASVPLHERFDLVVGNPPSFCALNPAHPLFGCHDRQNRLIAYDSDWAVHAGFYSQIASFLNPGAFLLIGEAEPRSREVFVLVDNPAFEIRREVPSVVFADMIRRGGLLHIADVPLHAWPAFGEDAFNVWLQISQKAA